VLRLPGSIQARESLVELGSKHLRLLQQRGGGDPALLLELATGHDRLGEIEAGLGTPHLGDLDEALEHYRVARDLRLRILTRHPNNADALIGLARSSANLSEVERQHERIPESIVHADEGLGYLDRLEPDAAQSPDARIERSKLLVMKANMLGRLRADDGEDDRLDLLKEAERVTERFERESPTDRARQARARVQHNLGEYFLFVESSNAELAIGYLDEAVAVRQFLFDRQPTNAVWRRDLAGSLLSAGRAHALSGDITTANDLLDRSRSHFEFLIEADPDDVEARRRLSNLLEVLAIETDRPQGPERVALLDEAVTLDRRVLAMSADPAEEDLRRLGLHLRALGRNHRFAVTNDMELDEAIAQLSRACDTASEAYAVFDSLLRAMPTRTEWLDHAQNAALDHARAIGQMGSVGAGADELHARWSALAGSIAETLSWADRTPEADAAGEPAAKLRRWLDYAEQQLTELAEAPTGDHSEP